MILASLMLLGGSLVTKQHAMVQNSPGQSLTDDDCEKLRKRLTEAEKAVKDALDYENYTAAQYTKALDAYDQIKKSVSKGLDFAAAIATADTQIESSNHAIASDKEQLVNAKESGDSVLISVYEQDISDNEKSIKLLEEHKLDLQKQLKKQNEPLEVAFKQMMAAKMDLWDATVNVFFRKAYLRPLKRH